MGVEIEYKFEITEIEKISKILNTIAKQTIKSQYQKNVMFDNEQKIMSTTNGRIRVRTLGDTGQKILTYKRPLKSLHHAKRETEYEVKFFDKNQNIENILKYMGYKPTTSYERYRSEWQASKCNITIDEYPFTNYLEIEGDIANIDKIVKLLGFKKENGLTDPVDTLFQDWRKNNNLPFTPHIRFGDHDK